MAGVIRCIESAAVPAVRESVMEHEMCAVRACRCFCLRPPLSAGSVTRPRLADVGVLGNDLESGREGLNRAIVLGARSVVDNGVRGPDEFAGVVQSRRPIRGG